MRVLLLALLTAAAWGQSFSDPVPDGTWWRDATAQDRSAFVKGVRVGMAADPSYLTRTEKQLQALIAAFYASGSNSQSTITAAFRPAATKSPSTMPTTVEFPPPPAIPSPLPLPQTYQDPLAGLGPPATTGVSAEPARTKTFRVGNGVTAPALLYKVEPEYTELARNAHVEGLVVLYVEVDPEGKAINPRVVRTLGYGLDEKAIEAVRKWKFRPGYKDGKPVSVVATIQVNFRLTKNPPPIAAPGTQSTVTQMGICSFSGNGCYRIPDAASVRGQMIQLSDTQFAIFDGTSWRLADIH